MRVESLIALDLGTHFVRDFAIAVRVVLLDVALHLFGGLSLQNFAQFAHSNRAVTIFVIFAEGPPITFQK